MRNEESKSTNIIKVLPRRKQINHKGFHGWIEYKPSDKKWHWKLKTQFTITQEGTNKTEEEAVLELKRAIDITANTKHARSID